MGTFNEIIPKTIVFAVILVFFAIFYVELEPEPKTQAKVDSWNKAFSALHERFKVGDQEKAFTKISDQCGIIFSRDDISQNFSRCNPEFLTCFFADKKLEANGREFKVQVKKVLIEDKPLNPNTISGVHTIVSLEDTKTNITQKILLENTCSETYIPIKGDHSYFVDIFQVRVLDVNRWIDKKNETLSIKKVNDPLKQSHASTNLTLQEKRLFCESHGKSLLDKGLWEQASYYPDYSGKKLFKHPYHWMKKHTLDKNAGDTCSKLYSKECLASGKPYIQMSDNSISWSGVKEVMGGEPEVFANGEILTSSKYFNKKDINNQLGQYKTKATFKKPTAFRCMRKL